MVCMHDQKCNNSIYRFLFWVFCPVLLMSIIIVASKSVYADNYMEVSAYYLRIEMLVPAFAAMVSKLYIQRNETPAKKFYYFYIVFIGILFSQRIFYFIYSGILNLDEPFSRRTCRRWFIFDKQPKNVPLYLAVCCITYS